MEFVKNMNKLAGKPFWVFFRNAPEGWLARIRYDPKEKRYVAEFEKEKLYDVEVKKIFLKLRELNDQIIGAE